MTRACGRKSGGPGVRRYFPATSNQFTHNRQYDRKYSYQSAHGPHPGRNISCVPGPSDFINRACAEISGHAYIILFFRRHEKADDLLRKISQSSRETQVFLQQLGQIQRFFRAFFLTQKNAPWSG
jgi:hypothetical protein